MRLMPSAWATSSSSRIAFQALIYPAVEHNWDSGSALENAEGYLLQRESMRWFWGHYLDGATDDDWVISLDELAELTGDQLELVGRLLGAVLQRHGVVDCFVAIGVGGDSTTSSARRI